MIKRLTYINNDANEQKLRHASDWVVEQNIWKKRRVDVVRRLVEYRE